MKNIINQKIIDAHHHFWNFNENKHDWLSLMKNKNFHRSYLNADFKNDFRDLKIEKSVHIQGEINREFSLFETEWMQELSDNDEKNMPNAIIAYIDLLDKSSETIIEKHKNFKNFRGFRQILKFDNNIQPISKQNIDLLKNETWIKNMQLIQKYNLIFELLAYYTQFHDLEKLVKIYPNISFVINHALWPEGVNLNDSNFMIWKKGIDTLSEFPNVFIKLSGFGELNSKWTSDFIEPFILYILEKFGFDRCMFASNFPVDKNISDSPYFNYWYSYYKITNNFSQNELDKIFYLNAEKFYNI